MKKYIALFLTLGFFAFLPSAVADDGTLAVDTPAHIRLPHNHNDNHNIILTLQVNNIQVEAGWQVHSDSSLSLQISNGVLSINEPLTITQIVATVIVQDLFTKLNQAYANLSAQAVITIEIVYLSLLDAPHLRALVGYGGVLHTLTTIGEPTVTAYDIVGGSDYFVLNGEGVLLVAHVVIPVGFHTLTVEARANDGNKAQAVAIVHIFSPLSLSDAPFLHNLISENAVSLHTFTASGGGIDKTYTVVPAPSSYFSLDVASGVLSAVANVPASLYILTVQAADEYNNTIRALATVEIFLPLSVLPHPSELVIIASRTYTPYPFATVGGTEAKTYTFLSGNDAGYFTISNDGKLHVDNAQVGQYPLVIEVSDSAGNKATITVTLTAITQDIQR